MAATIQVAKPGKPLTLEQQRAADAWKCAQGQNGDYANLAKSLPALIMNSGLLQVMAFLNEKGKKQSHYAEIATQLRRWLHKRFRDMGEDFAGCMNDLINADSRKFQAVTAEALAWLRWLRQIAPA